MSILLIAFWSLLNAIPNFFRIDPNVDFNFRGIGRGFMALSINNLNKGKISPCTYITRLTVVRGLPNVSLLPVYATCMP